MDEKISVEIEQFYSDTVAPKCLKYIMTTGRHHHLLLSLNLIIRSKLKHLHIDKAMFNNLFLRIHVNSNRSKLQFLTVPPPPSKEFTMTYVIVN